MADVNDIVGSSGDDILNAAPGANNIVGGPEHSTLSNDAFPSRGFDSAQSNSSGRIHS
jgi:hypothetical protein